MWLLYDLGQVVQTSLCLSLLICRDGDSRTYFLGFVERIKGLNEMIYGKDFSQCPAHSKYSKYTIVIIIQVFWGQSWFQIFCSISRLCVPIWNSKMWSLCISRQHMREALFFQASRHKTASTPYAWFETLSSSQRHLIKIQSRLVPLKNCRGTSGGGRRGMILNPEVVSQ